MPVERYHTITVDGDCTVLGNLNFKYCFTKYDCTPTSLDWLLVACGDQWCNVMSDIDHAYSMPFVPSDTIHLQYRIDDAYNTDPLVPTAGWGEWVQAKIITPDQTYTGSEIDPFVSRKIVGVINGESYQIIELDTQALFDADIFCFEVQVDAYNSELEIVESICTFVKWNVLLCDEPSVLVQGIYETFDCFGNYYGDPDNYVGDLFKYNNQQRFKGYVFNMPTQTKKTLTKSSSKVTEVEIFSNSLLVITNLLPSNIEKTLYSQLLGGIQLFIDNKEYLFEGHTSELIENMFKCEVPIYLKCNSSKNC